jgi:hypothetical protein
MTKPLASSTVNDLVKGKNTNAPDAWTVSMFVLACVCWGDRHGSPVLREFSLVEVRTLLGQWQQRRTDYEDLLRTSPLEDVRQVRVGVVPMLADHFQDRAIALKLGQTSEHTGTVLLTQGVKPASGKARPTTILTGTGGVGKTQLAADFATRIWLDSDVRMAIWATADSRESVIAAYAEAAAGLLGADTTDLDRAARQLLTWMATAREQWVVVLDDLRRPEDLLGLWPTTGRYGRVVVTTRRRDPSLGRNDRVILDVEVFTPAESSAYLTAKLANYPGLVDGAVGLAETLGHLPLALAQAVAYQLNRNLTCTQYLGRYLDRTKTLHDVLPDSDELPDDHQRTVATTWSLSIDQADTLKPKGLARPLLELASLLDAAGSPAAVFENTNVLDYLTDVLDAPVNCDAVDDALSILYRFSLITLDRTQPARTVQIHALVQRAVRDTLTPDRLDQLVRPVAAALLDIWPDVDKDAALAKAFRSASESINRNAKVALWRSGEHRLLVCAGRSLGDAGLLTAATVHFQELYEQACFHLGSDHPDTLTIRGYLARWQAKAGDVIGSITQLRELLADRLRLLGPDHPDTLVSRGNLARWLADSGDVDSAIDEFEELLTVMVRALGADHSDVFAVRANLAFWRARNGDVDRAVSEYRELISDQIRVLGSGHPQTLTSRNSLIHFEALYGGTDGGIGELEQLFADRLRVLGPDHPDTLSTRNNIACFRAQNGDLSGAIAESKQVLADRLRVLGPDHPDTLVSRGNLAQFQAEVGDVDNAINGFETLLIDLIRVLGLNHPYVQAVRDNIARLREPGVESSGEH